MTAKLLNGHPSDCACADCQRARAVLAIVFEHPSGCTCATCAMPLGRCRYCRAPRPAGYAVTCGGSYCQEAAYHDKERRTPRRAKGGAR